MHAAARAASIRRPDRMQPAPDAGLRAYAPAPFARAPLELAGRTIVP
jgi:hypothetical protein